MVISFCKVPRSVDETLFSSGHSVFSVAPAAPGAAQDGIHHVKDTRTSTHRTGQDNPIVKVYISERVSRHPRRIPVILKDGQGK